MAIYLSLGLHKGSSSYRRSLQLSKENIQHFKTANFLTFFVGHFCLPGSGFGSAFPMRIQPIKIIADSCGSESETLEGTYNSTLFGNFYLRVVQNQVNFRWTEIRNLSTTNSLIGRPASYLKIIFDSKMPIEIRIHFKLPDPNQGV